MIAQKKFQIPVKKCNISDYKWQFLLLLSTYPYVYVVICTYLLRHSFQFFIDVNCGSCEDNATSQQCRSTVVLSEKNLCSIKGFPNQTLLVCLFFHQKDYQILQILSRYEHSSCTYNLLHTSGWLSFSRGAKKEKT